MLSSLLTNLGQLTTISLADAPMLVLACVAALIYRLAMVYWILYSLANVLKVKKPQKFVHRTFDMIHYTVSALIGVIAIANRPHGHCFAYARNCQDLFVQNQDGFIVSVFEKIYFFVFFSYYAVDCLFLWTASEKLVMYIHHVVTLSEVICCVVLQSPVVGLSIMLLHDVTDVPLYVSKFMVYLGLNSIAQVGLATFAISVTYFRIFNYPIIVYLVYVVGWYTDLHQTLMRFQTCCLCILYGLHIIWECKIIGVVYHAVVGGKVKDSRSE
jgi:hypothetical protein